MVLKLREAFFSKPIISLPKKHFYKKDMNIYVPKLSSICPILKCNYCKKEIINYNALNNAFHVYDYDDTKLYKIIDKEFWSVRTQFVLDCILCKKILFWLI